MPTRTATLEASRDTSRFLVRLPCVRPGPPRPPTVQDPSLGPTCSPVGDRCTYVASPRPPDANVAPAPTALRRHGAGSVAGHYRGAANVPVRRRGAAFRAERRRGAAFSAERRHGAAQTIQRQRGATSVAAHHRGAANVHVCRRGAVFGARRRRGTARTASSVAERHRGAANVHVRHRGAILRAERHRGAAQTALEPTWRQFSDVAPPWCSQRTRAPSWRNLQGRAPPWRCPNVLRAPAWPWCVLQANTRGTMTGSALGAPPPSVTPRAEVTSHRRYSPPHVPSANVAVSLGHHRGATFSVTYRLGARIVGLVVWARPLRQGVVGDLHSGAPPWCYGCDARPALTEPGGTQATGGARDRVAWPYSPRRRYSARRQCA